MKELIIKHRHLPHWTLEGSVYYITFCAQNTILSEQEQQVVLNHIKDGERIFYTCYATVVMPDHVHLLLSPNPEFTLSRVMEGIKGVSAYKINRLRKTRGQIWQHESYDRIVRNEDEFFEKLNYMFNNPVRKGLTDNPWTYKGWFLNDDM